MMLKKFVPSPMKQMLKKIIPSSIKQTLKQSVPAPIQEAVRQSPLKEIVKQAIAPSRAITTLEELDAEIEKCDQLAAISADEFTKAVSSFHFEITQPLPKDPRSPEYFEFQRQLYLQISGRDRYDSHENERSPFDLETAKKYPYPYHTKSATIVGDQLIAQGFLIKAMNLPPNARVLEFGPGWGNTTLHMLQMGYEMTAVDVEPDFLRLIEHRAGALSDRIKLVNQDMTDFESDQKYDAVVFFECFHHCSDHIQLLKKLDTLLTDTGVIAFAAEPIVDFPYPWGVRLDGISVYSIRKYGWLELGFNTNYFLKLLNDMGWTVQHHRSDINHMTNVFIARKS